MLYGGYCLYKVLRRAPPVNDAGRAQDENIQMQ
eukprot:SAG31_NODE_683_length_12836_cov_8.304938_15_plen_33_part_00